MRTTVSIIVPAKNEEGNIAKLLDGIATNMDGIPYEVLVVDDSDDDKTMKLAIGGGARVIVGQHKGLGQAILDGINESNGEIALVMDADGQHSPQDIPNLIRPITRYGIDFVIGSRYVKGGGTTNWGRKRKLSSQVGSAIMRFVTGVRDSNSGFFALRKTIIDGVKLNPDSWKMMLEILFKAKWVSKLEVPIQFRERQAGKSKNSGKESIRQAKHLVKLLVQKYGRFINFALVGGIGALWYFSLLYALTEYAHIWYGLSAVLATFVAITNNYLINHYYTFRHIKENNKSLFRGWLKYILNSVVGDGVDWVILVVLTEVFGMWYMLSAFLASGVACIIKYMIAKKWIWGKKGKVANDADYEWVSFYRGLPWQKWWKQKLAGIVSNMAGNVASAGKVLDIGCGSSPLGVLANHTLYTGIDTNANKVEYMKAKNLHSCQFEAINCESLSFGDDSFDTVLFIEVIEHLPDLKSVRQVLNEIHRVLVMGGQAIIATPNYGSWTGKWMDRLYGVFQKGAYKEDHHLKFTHSSLKLLCAENGLSYECCEIPIGADMVCKFIKKV